MNPQYTTTAGHACFGIHDSAIILSCVRVIRGDVYTLVARFAPLVQRTNERWPNRSQPKRLISPADLNVKLSLLLRKLPRAHANVIKCLSTLGQKKKKQALPRDLYYTATPRLQARVGEGKLYIMFFAFMRCCCRNSLAYQRRRMYTASFLIFLNSFYSTTCRRAD